MTIDRGRHEPMPPTSVAELPLTRRRWWCGWIVATLVGSLILPSALFARPAITFGKEIQERRQALSAACAKGIVLLPSSWRLKALAEDSFRQDSDFYYFTGIETQIGAVLAVDGPGGESVLFVPDSSAAVRFFGATRDSGASSARDLGLSRVLPIDELVPFLDSRLRSSPQPPLCLGEQESAVPGAPPIPGLAPFGSASGAFGHALAARWPRAVIEDVSARIGQLRSRKSIGELSLLRSAGRAASAALIAGLRSLGPGRTQRSIEVEVAAACYANGADGVAWWPWVQSGPNAIFPTTFTSFADPRHLDREMRDGELVRLDIGCQNAHYNSDVGRTAPVSGRWSGDQREIWNLLIGGYRAGLEAIRDGVTVEAVRQAFEGSVRASQEDLESARAREAAAILLDRERSPFWQIHGVGLSPAEALGPLLRQGMVVAFEPIFAVDSEGYYLEDLILVTGEGYELLTPNLPYTAEEIEAVMAPPPRP